MVRRIYVDDRHVNATPSTRRLTIRSDDLLAGVFKKSKSRREGARLLDMNRERFTRRLREALGEATHRKDSEKADT